MCVWKHTNMPASCQISDTFSETILKGDKPVKVWISLNPPEVNYLNGKYQRDVHSKHTGEYISKKNILFTLATTFTDTTK